jgi:hypothetical protein
MTLKGKNIHIVTILLACFSSFVLSSNVHAATEDELYKKALLNDMSVCYDESEMYGEIKDGEYSSLNYSILKKDKKQDTLYIPTGIGQGNSLDITTKRGTKIGCYELFNGDKVGFGTYDGSMTGLLGLYGVSVPDSTSSEVPEFLRKMGYIEQFGNGASMSCLTAKYLNDDMYGEEYKDLATFCWRDSDLNKSEDEIDAWEYTGNFIRYDLATDAPIDMTVNYDEQFGIGFWPYPNKDQGYMEAPFHSGLCYSTYVIPGAFYTVTKDNLKNAANSEYYAFCNVVKTADSNYDNPLRYKIKFFYDEKAVKETLYQLQSNRHDSYNTAVKEMFGSAEEEFSDNDKYELYSLYLTKIYKATVANGNCQSTKPSSATPTDSDGITHYKIQTSAGWCDISVNTDNTRKKVSGFTANERYILDTEYDFAGLVNAMFKLNVDTAKAVDVAEYGPDANGMTQTELSKAAQDPCYTSSDSLGWIICPVVKTATRAMLNMYNHVEEDFLVVESELTKSDSATRSAWNFFVNFANIAMVILLLVVIVSQITGAGIDNYGIKKLLPKIITVAILINLSFIICQLAVDVSNIVGRSLKDLLVNISKDISLVNVSLCSGGSCNSSAEWFKVLVTVAGGGIVGLGGLELVQGVLTNGMLDGLIIPILILILVAVIAVIFFFILLGLRKAAIVILIVISPLAFICYALPNTKKLFTKWFDAMKGLLLLYPLCGLVVGGGTLASKIILSASQDYVTFFIGTIIMVVPFFMIPSLLKSSFKALGGIGAKISGLGKSLRTKTRARAEGVQKNSAGYKARQADFANRAKFRQERATDRRAKRAQRRLAGRSDLSEAQKNRLRYANDAVLARENQLQENDIRVDTNYLVAARNQQQLDAEKQRQEIGIRASKDYVGATRNQQKLATEKQRRENELHATDDYYNAMQAKQGLDIEHENKVIGRYGDKTYVESQKAALEADSRSKDVDAELALLRNRDNVNTLTEFESHLEALKNRTSFGDSERTELAALARGIVGFKGGAGALAKMVRDSSSSDAFRQALSSIYSQDISVSSKLNEKDAGASIYLEALGSGGTTGNFASYASSDPASAYQVALGKRVKSNAAGLNQSGAAFTEYLNSLASETPPATDSEEFIKAKNRLQDVMNDATLLNSLDVKDREAVRTRAAIYGVTGAEAQAVRIIHEQQPAPQSAPQSRPTQDEQGELHVNFPGDGGMDG